MAKYKHKLEVLFACNNSDTIYDGIIYHSKKVIDHVTVKTDTIIIEFERSSKKKKEEILDSPKSNIREHLQKALCFYLATQGTIPDVKDIVYTCGDNAVSMPHEHFAATWKNCDITITLPVENAGVIFKHYDNSEEKVFYAVITHFLKAQLDNFSHDRFRSAWSTLNALYTYIDDLSNDGYRSEEEKISTLRSVIDNNDMFSAVSLINELGNSDFWERLSWYHEFNVLTEKQMRKLFSGGVYNDTELLKCFYKYLCGIQKLEEAHPDLCREFEAKIKKRKIIRPKDKLKFIVCKYCYDKRNVSYHAQIPYPVFVISDEAETSIEQVLTEIVLLTVKDLFAIYSAKLNS